MFRSTILEYFYHLMASYLKWTTSTKALCPSTLYAVHDSINLIFLILLKVSNFCRKHRSRNLIELQPLSIPLRKILQALKYCYTKPHQNLSPSERWPPPDEVSSGAIRRRVPHLPNHESLASFITERSIFEQQSRLKLRCNFRETRSYPSQIIVW